MPESERRTIDVGMTNEKSEPGEFTIILTGAIILKNGRLFHFAGPAYYPGLDYEQMVAVEQAVGGGLLDLGVKQVEAKKEAKKSGK